MKSLMPSFWLTIIRLVVVLVMGQFLATRHILRYHWLSPKLYAARKPNM